MRSNCVAKTARRCGLYSATPIFDAQGAHVANLIMHSDFTAAKAADEALRESEDKYRTMVETSAEGVVVAGPDGAYTYVNQRMADMLGYRPDELLGKSANDLTCDRGLLAQVLNARDGLARGDAVHGEIEFRRRDGSSLWTMYSISPLHDASGAHIGNLAMHTDITGRKRAEEDRQRLLEDSQAQGEELQAQAEELQTQAEEMQIQGEELRAQSEELFTQRDELLRESELRAGLNALTLLLHSTLKPDEVMRRALVEATRVLAIDAAAIALPEGDTWPVRFAAGLPPEALGSPLTGEPAISRLLAHSGEVLVLDQVTDHETVDPFATRLGVRSLMAVPLIAQEQVIGTLLLVERRTTRHFTEAEIDFARRLGTSVSLALENARLFEAEREAQRNAGEELQATTRLLEAARALADWRDLGEVVRALAQTLLHSTAHTRAMVSLWDEGRGEFELIAAEGLRPMPLGSRWAMDVSSTAAVKAVTQRSAQVWDLDALPEAKRGQQWADYQPHLALHVPLVGREKVVGLLSLDDPGERREFGEREIKLVEGIAANATVAIENARLFSNTLEQSQHLTNVLQSMTDGFVSVDRTWCYTLVNPQAERLIGRPAAELLGKSMEELFPDMYGWSHYSKVMSERLPETFETWSVPLKTWLEIRAYPTLDGMSILFSDISTRKAAAEELRLHNEELAEGARLADSLNAINRLLHATLDFDTIMQGALDEGVGALGAHAGMIEMREESQWVVRYQHGLAEADVGLRLSAAEAPVAARVEERGEPVVVADAKADGAVSIGFVRKHSLGSLLAAPLVARGAVIGCMVFYGASVRAFSDSEIDFARKLGATVSLAVENARLYEEQQRIAQTLQENFVHEPPEVPGLELGVVSNTAFEPELVGGDFSDVFVVDDTHVVLLIGDVAGKGVRAAGMTETVRSTVRALASANPSPAFVLAKANELLLRFDPDEPHVTAFLAVLDPNTGHLSYASAGHPAPVHLSAYACRPLDTTFGPPLGSFERSYTNGHTVLTLDDYLVLYTDGVTEARRGLELLGETRLLEIVAGLRGRPVQEVADGVRDAALAFADKLSDDLQVVVLRLA